jgi:predicted ATP-dependent endonuclease of OLD family
VITLIGLNESGKTTVLEGISLFPISDKAAASTYKPTTGSLIESEMVPIYETGTFTGKIEVLGSFTLDDEEWNQVRDIVKSRGYEINEDKKVKTLTISKVFDFLDGDYVPEKFCSFWSGVDIQVRKTKGESIYHLRQTYHLKVKMNRYGT